MRINLNQKLQNKHNTGKNGYKKTKTNQKNTT